MPYPRILRPTGGAHFARVAAGAMHSLGLTSSGQVYAWGDGSFGALGQLSQPRISAVTCRALDEDLPRRTASYVSTPVFWLTQWVAA